MIMFSEEAFKRTQQHYFSRVFSWLIDSKMRRATNLSKWIKDQVNNPTQELLDFADTISNGKDYDETVMNVFLMVVKRITYISDDKKWSMPEKWATAHETLTLTTTTKNDTFYSAMSGDCEDGAILLYVLCRLKGVPSNRFLLFCGDVVGGGHCWLGYKPSFVPWQFTFMDWCYWVSKKNIIDRDRFFIHYQDINNKVYPESNYLKVWFAFNEDVAYNKFKLKWS